MTDDGPPIDRLRGLLADRALQGLDDPGRDELARLVESEALRFELAAAEAALALDPPTEPLPDALRRRLEAAAPAALRQARSTGRPAAARAAPWLGWVVAAALLVAVALPARREAPAPSIVERLSGVSRLRLSATEHPLARGGAGELAWSGDRQEGYLSLRGLAEVDPDRGVYQLWIFDEARDERFPVDGGTFAVLDAGDSTLVTIHPALPVRRPTLFAVTLEPPGGVVVSDRKRIVLTASPPP